MLLCTRSDGLLAINQILCGVYTPDRRSVLVKQDGPARLNRASKAGTYESVGDTQNVYRRHASNPTPQDHPRIKGGGGLPLGHFCAIQCARWRSPPPLCNSKIEVPPLVQFEMAKYCQIRAKQNTVVVGFVSSAF